MGDFNLVSPLTVLGKGPGKTKVDAKGLDRVFTAGGPGKVKLQGLTIKGGDSGANPGHSNVGGGVTAFAAKVVLKNVVIMDNDAQFGGGVSSVASDLTIRRSTIGADDASRGNRAEEGGGVDLRSAITTPVTRIRFSTVSGNIASVKGGILADGAPSGSASAEPFLVIENSTVAFNFSVSGTGTREAGGIMGDNGAVVALEASTVAFNLAG